LAVCGVALIVLFLPAALESRRLWLYQQDRVEKAPQEIRDLRARNDPASLKRARELERFLGPGGWIPEWYHTEYQWRMLGVYLGAAFLAVAVAIPLLRRRVTHSVRPALPKPIEASGESRSA
jgi:hypothetical protein